MEALNLKYEGYKGITGVIFEEINVIIKNNLVTVKIGSEIKSIKLVEKRKTYTNNDYLFQLKKTQLNILENDGIKLFIEAQDKKDTFFNMIRSLFNSIATLKNLKNVNPIQ